MNWSEIIAFLRDAGYSQGEIAKACGCAQPTVSELATGKIKDPRDSIGQSLRALYAKAQKKQKAKAV